MLTIGSARQLLLAVPLLAAPLQAQAAAERAPLLALIDSVARWDSIVDRGPYEAALQRIERTLDRHGDWPVAWYALGRINHAMWDRHFVAKTTPYHAAGVSYRRAAMEAFARGVKADASYLPSSSDLARLIVGLGNRKLDQDFVAPLETAGRIPTVDPIVFLALARIRFSGGKYEAALDAVGHYANGGGDRGVAGVERARVLQALNHPDESLAAYTAGLTELSDSGAAAYREDLAWVANPDELTALDSLPVDSTAGWVTRFWRERDALEMRQPGERLREHLRRWVYAYQKFRVFRPDDAPNHTEGQRPEDQQSILQGMDPSLAIVLSEVALNNPGWKLYRRTQWELDDRGAIYIRHGEPTKKVSSTSGPPNESWLYQRATGRPIFHFLSSSALGTTAATTLVASLPLTPEMLDARGDLDPRYQALGDYIQGRRDIMQAYVTSRVPKDPDFLRALQELRSGRSGRSAIVLSALAAVGARGSSMPTLSTSIPQMAKADELRGRATIREAMTSDGYPLVFTRQLDAVIQLHGVGIGAPGTRRILSVYAVEGSQLLAQARPDGKPGFLYPVSIRLIAMDRAGGIVRQLDTIRNYVARDSLRAGQHLSGFLELPVPPGYYQARILITSPTLDAGAAGARDDIDLTEARNSVMISDLILGRENSGLTWRFGERSPALNPLNAFPRGTDAELFYEIDGLTPGAAYRVDIGVRRAGEARDRPALVDVSFSFTAAGRYGVVTRGLGLRELKPGAYALTVTVASGDGRQTATRARALNVLER